MNPALVTAIYGAYNTPKKLPDDLECHAYLFTESEETAELAEKAGWCPRIVDHHFESPNGDPEIVTPMLNHKYWKCHPELAAPDSDLVIWIDGSMEIVVPDFVRKCKAALCGGDWACMPHPERTCIYPEAEYSATLWWRYDAPSILAQAAHYRNFHPANWGLVATGFSVRRINETTIRWSHHWWEEILRWSHQDQISLPVLLRLAEQEDNLRWNKKLPWFEWLRHHPHG